MPSLSFLMSPETRTARLCIPAGNVRLPVDTVASTVPQWAPARGSVLHVFQTLPGMLAVIVAAVAGAIGALGAVAAAIPTPGVYLTGTAGFLFVLVMMGFWSRMSYKRASPGVQPRFPSPQEAEGN